MQAVMIATIVPVPLAVGRHDLVSRVFPHPSGGSALHGPETVLKGHAEKNGTHPFFV